MKFYDTCALLDLGEAAFDEKFLLSNITLLELEDIKTSGKKNEDTRYKARRVTRLLAEPAHSDCYTILSVTHEEYEKITADLNIPVADTNDTYILAAAFKYYFGLLAELDAAGSLVTEGIAQIGAEADSFCFVTSDLSCANLAANVFGLPTELTHEVENSSFDYKGWAEVQLAEGGENALATFYQDPTAAGANIADTPLNGYLIIKDGAGATVDMMRWDGERYVPLKYKCLNTAYSGKIKPLNDQQKLAFDLLQNQDITIKLLLGVYGSGKDYLMINHALDLIEKGKYNKIVWVRNNIEVKDTKEIGFLPGSMLEKIYPFAAILADCLGGQVALERAIADGWVEIQPLGFIRGRSFTKSIIYCSEAENLTKEHIQLLIGRIGEESSLWINGDLRQVDDVVFERNNGIQKLIERVVGNECFGTVYLPTTERSKTARIADLLD